MSAKVPIVALAPWLALAWQVDGQAQAPTPSSAPALLALMPQPRFVEHGDGWLPVKGGFRVDWMGHRNALLDRAVLRFQKDSHDVPASTSVESAPRNSGSIVGARTRAT